VPSPHLAEADAASFTTATSLKVDRGWLALMRAKL